MSDKLRLDYFLSVGGKLAKDDGCYNVENEEPNVFKEVMQKGDAFAGQLRFSGEGYGIYGKGDLKHLVITSFTDRENEGVQPVADGDFPVDAKLRCGESRNEKAIYLTWSTASHEGDIITWKPDYNKLLEMQHEYDAKHKSAQLESRTNIPDKNRLVDIPDIKTPIYTQEMKRNGEFPKVGMKCEVKYSGGGTFSNAIIKFISDYGVVHADAETGVEIFCGSIHALDINPYKTPEQIKLEEAKKKQLEDMCFKYKNLPLEVAMQMQGNGDLPEIVIDDLSARGMAKQ